MAINYFDNADDQNVEPNQAAADVNFDADQNGGGGRDSDLMSSRERVPTADRRLSVIVTSTLIDRYEGLTSTETIWDETPNFKYIVDALADGAVRDAVARFFVERGMHAVIKKLLPPVFIRPSETAFTKADFATAVASRVESEAVAAPIVELALPSLLKLGLISNNIKYSRQTYYGFGRVTSEDIRHNVAMYSVLEEVKKVNIKVNAAAKVSPSVFAEAVSEALRPVGLAIYEVIDMARVVDDIVRGVRSHLDPSGMVGQMTGSVPADWRTNRVVTELATNLVFIRAALSLPKNYHLSLSMDPFKLDKMAPVVLAAIKSSERYSWVSKAEALRHYALRKAYSVHGEPKAAVITRQVETAPVAQAVFAVRDIAHETATIINATRDRIADVIQSAYGSAKFSTLSGADLLLSNVQDLVELGYGRHKAIYLVDASGATMSVSDIAVFVADQLYVSADDEGFSSKPGTLQLQGKESVWDPEWWFSVSTKEKSLKVWSGQHLGDRVVTNDPAEVLLATAEFDSKDALPVRPQLLAAAAFNSRVIDFSEKMLKGVSARFSFKIRIGNVSAMGTFRAAEFASLRSGQLTSIVRPYFNAETIDGLATAYRQASDLVREASRSDESSWATDIKPDTSVLRFAEHRAARQLLLLAQKLSPAFRKEVHDMVIETAVVQARLAGSEADHFRAKMTQKPFGAFVDLLALRFFLFLQGIEVPIWDEIISSEAAASVCLEMGTDR